jgi:hypothetical protein
MKVPTLADKEDNLVLGQPLAVAMLNRILNLAITTNIVPVAKM